MEYSFPRNQFTRSNNVLSADASDLGLPVGEFPTHLTVRGDTEITTFVFHSRDGHDGDLQLVRYHPTNPGDIRRLIIFND